MNLPDASEVFNRSSRSSTKAMSAVHAVSTLFTQRACSGWLLALTEFRIILRRPSHHPAVRENDGIRAIGGIEAHDDVAVTGQILGECRVIPHLGRSPRSHDHHRVRSLLR